MKYRVTLAATLVLGLLSDGCPDVYRIPGNRPILDWWGENTFTREYELFPAFFETDPHVCAADPTRVYIAELFSHGINDVEVDWHWAPLIPGPDAKRPTVEQPEYFLAGAVETVNDSDDDVLADHPFGLDANADVIPDPTFAFLADGDSPDSTLHVETETRIFPRNPLGFVPQAGDRTIMRGVWVLDCGHPPYGTEMHPPTFLNYARAADPQTTVSAAVVVPYRSSLLFNPNVGLADDFANTKRYASASTRSFEQALIDAILHAVVNQDDHLEAHALMAANRFDTLDWMVCAPLPRPQGAVMRPTWRFTMRSGVTLHAELHDADGCVRFRAEMGADYAPMALPYLDAQWPWAQLSASASNQLGQPIDVRQSIIDTLAAQGIDASSLPAFQDDHPPRVDAYAELTPRPGADQDAPAAIVEHADDQPFPLYGRVSVGWATP